LEIYLDNCSTTKPREEVVEKMVHFLTNEYGNPSSLHRLGFKIEKSIEEVRQIIADFLKVRKDEIYFTSGGTESNNLAIGSILKRYKRQGNHIITTKIEHSSVLNPIKGYEAKGFKVTYLNVDRDGIISMEELKQSLREETVLVSIMQVNNEIGSIQPIWRVKDILNQRGSKALLHVDGIQGFGKVPLDIKGWGIDAFSFSGHKIYGPKGIGGLYLDRDLKTHPIILGGAQERGLRSGTENVPGIMGLGKAVEIIGGNFHKERDKAHELKSYFIDKLEEQIPHIRINSPLGEKHSPYILNISFKYIKGEVLLHYLEDKGIYVATGSACSSKTKDKSHVLTNIGLSDEEIEGAIRICFSHENTKEQIDYTITVLKDSVEAIRQVTMR